MAWCCLGFSGIQDEILKPWQRSLVLLARDASGFASVCYDDEGAIITLMQRLFEQGHRYISYLGVPHTDVTTGKRRHEAYLTFCKKHNLPAVASLPGLGMKQGYEQAASVPDAPNHRAGLRHGYSGAWRK
ncbi:trehalose repressor [Enterobacter cancerogenus]|uniref:Trehalose repressor n=1 Tax=Enterobacter cancerogenus TaxID=69218 RepID=A0A484Z5L9_9ENTR|nr:trehalose repressor [Enterobacter cancerogenus]